MFENAIFFPLKYYGHLYLLMKIDTTVEKVSNHFLRYQMTTIQLQSFRQHNTLLLAHKMTKTGTYASIFAAQSTMHNEHEHYF